MKKYFDNTEKNLIEKIEKNKGWKIAENQNVLKKKLIRAAENHKEKNTRITLNVYTADLEKVKAIAKREGLPYQTYIKSQLHKIVASQDTFTGKCGFGFVEMASAEEAKAAIAAGLNGKELKGRPLTGGKPGGRRI